MKTFTLRLPDKIYKALSFPDKSTAQTIREILDAYVSGHFKGNYIRHLIDDFPVYYYDILFWIYQNLFDMALHIIAEEEKANLDSKPLIADFSRAIPLDYDTWKTYSYRNAQAIKKDLENKGHQVVVEEHKKPYLHYLVTVFPIGNNLINSL